ncbi:glycosyltransferase family 25 protein [Bartonella sp. LJL80]
MHIPVYIINLDRSKERLEAVSASATQAGLSYQRVPAVDGSQVDIQHCERIDEKRFRRRHGKNLLPGEVGCYLSHLDALSIIAKGDAAFAVIVEDDIAFGHDFSAILSSLTTISGWDVIKFANHRNRLFHRDMSITDDVSIGRFLHGPLGSSAAYMVTREGAAKLVAKLQPMSLPYDVALERGWTGYRLFSTNRNIVQFCDTSGSTITQGRKSYKNNRLPKWKRIGTFFFRLSDYIRRMVYAVMPSGLRRKGN